MKFDWRIFNQKGKRMLSKQCIYFFHFWILLLLTLFPYIEVLNPVFLISSFFVFYFWQQRRCTMMHSFWAILHTSSFARNVKFDAINVIMLMAIYCSYQLVPFKTRPSPWLILLQSRTIASVCPDRKWDNFSS